jgi:peptidoglycan/xylan/chitin deacetylase (PgdA/CDA1 family)
MKLPQHSRYEYVKIGDRPAYDWPGGKRLAFYLCTNIEYFAFGAGDGALDNAVIGARQTHRNYAWRDYGLRVGLWRLFDLLDDLKLPAAHNTNSLIYDYRPDIPERIRARGDEVIGHGRTNSEHQDHMWEADEARMIREVTETIARHEGSPPQGWMGPGLSESAVTPDLLKEAGYKFVMDWPCDDQPIWFKTRSGPLLCVPYSIEINDGPALARRQHSAREFADMIVDQFDEMIEQCVAQPLVCAIALHPFIVGQPFRLRPLRDALKHCVGHKHRERVWFTLPRDIARHCASLPPGTVPGVAARYA